MGIGEIAYDGAAVYTQCIRTTQCIRSVYAMYTQCIRSVYAVYVFKAFTVILYLAGCWL